MEFDFTEKPVEERLCTLSSEQFFTNYHYLYPRGLPYPVWHPDEIFANTAYLPFYWIGNYGTIIDKRSRIVVHPFMVHGYVFVNVAMKYEISDVYPTYRTMAVHRLIMEAFNPIENMHNMPIVHDNGVGYINVYDPNGPHHNLRWAERGDIPSRWDKYNDVGVKSTDEFPCWTDPIIVDICIQLENMRDTDYIIAVCGLFDDQFTRDRIHQIRTGQYRPDISGDYEFAQDFYTPDEVIAVCEALVSLRDAEIEFTSKDIELALAVMGYFRISRKFINKIHRRELKEWEYITSQFDY